jgi:hypothetical protein
MKGNIIIRLYRHLHPLIWDARIPNFISIDFLLLEYLSFQLCEAKSSLFLCICLVDFKAIDTARPPLSIFLLMNVQPVCLFQQYSSSLQSGSPSFSIAVLD